MASQQSAVVGVIVDGYSTGNFLPAAFRKIGASVVHVQSTPELMPSMLGPDLREYVGNVVHRNLDATVAELNQYTPVCVIAGQEPGVPLADRLSEVMGLPTNGSALSLARRNKFEMIETLRRAGIRCARQLKSNDPETLVEWAEADGSFPFVVKPLSSASTDGVYICDTADQVREAAKIVLSSRDIFDLPNEEALVQSYLSGAEYIVDTVSSDSRRYVCGVWEYEKRILNSSRRIYDKDILLSADSNPVFELVSYVDAVLDALNIRFGPTHAEVIMTPAGPALVEIGARLNGNMNPGFHDVCLGANQADLIALAHIRPGEFVARYGDKMYTKQQEAIVYNVSTTLDGVVEGVNESVVEKISRLKTVHLVSVKIKPGGRIRPTVDLLTSPLRIFMTGATYDDIMLDYRRIHEVKDEVYRLG